MTATSPQPLEALKIANQVRFTNATTRNHIRHLDRHDATHAAATILTNPSLAEGAFTVHHLLTAIRGVGHMKINDLLRETRVPDRRLDQLTVRQRRLIAQAIVKRWAP